MWLAASSIVLASSLPATVARSEWPSPGGDAPVGSERLLVEGLVTPQLQIPRLETSSILVATICFAVGFGACLLVVHALLPSLVHAQCVEIVRHYLSSTRPDSDIRVIMLDRESGVLRQPPGRDSAPATDMNSEPQSTSRHHRRIDVPDEPISAARVVPSVRRGEDVPDSMLSQIYEQNLHLRNQLRKHSRIVKP